MEATVTIDVEQLKGKSFSIPDEVRTFEKGKVEVVRMDGVTFSRVTLEPGWRWSTSIRPITETGFCEHSHLSYHISGRLRVRSVDGTEVEFGPGAVSSIPAGHDAWVAGNDPVVMIDITGMAEYAKRGSIDEFEI